MHGGHLRSVYAMIKAFKLIIYHVVLPRTKDSDGFRAGSNYVIVIDYSKIM